MAKVVFTAQRVGERLDTRAVLEAAERHQLRPAEAAVLRALLARAKAGVRDVPSGAELAARAGVKGATGPNAMRRLVALGVIDVDDQVPRAAPASVVAPISNPAER